MLFLPVGPPGCGKSTLREWCIAEGILTKRMIVSPDDLRVWVTGTRADQTGNAAVFRIVDEVIRERLRRNLTCYLDATNLTGLPERLHEARELGRDVVIITFPAADDHSLLRERNENRHDKVPGVVLERMIARWNSVRFTLGSGFPNVRIMDETKFKEEADAGSTFSVQQMRTESTVQ